MKNLKLDRGAFFIEFYYTGLSIMNSKDLAAYVKLNRWYFDRMNFEIQEQFRQMYRNLKRMEVENGQKN
ncbi:hypothetical protein C4N20_00250 [Fusobacterium ulcerans]|uniref:YARHG domain-containing protein n=1 Tax=Fusobacterium ulcerans TaxID=861 RepID=A0AAX2JCQ6_9FUSO|nr:hypothetical protein [Fusobacterium ulcerans]AVQ26576.1 hypothetical protein C4N20_00250 [Fusobacterium ulcerans]EFS25310.2 hypothetical protein FUAG_00825 [Fusobacterium ulcerans ATCC 49185]SQJ04815.1 Uncharacterised protein [Fusobacterium ulcerans]